MSCPRPRRPRRQAGFTLIEVMFAGVVLAIALLGHVASTLHEHRLALDGQVRSEALHVAHQFVERMRADEDWDGLYGRILLNQAIAHLPFPNGPRLHNGLRAFSPRHYYPDFELPDEFASMTVLAEVPVGLDPVTYMPVLREDETSVKFGLPADLNGDGVINSGSRSTDYRALPVVLTFRWVPLGEASRQMRISTWLRGDR